MVVVVDRALADRHARLGNEIGHVFGRNRMAGHAPVLAAFAQGRADLRRTRVEIADDALRDELLQLGIRAKRQVHPFRIGADEHKVVREDEVDGLGDLRRLLGRS